MKSTLTGFLLLLCLTIGALVEADALHRNSDRFERKWARTFDKDVPVVFAGNGSKFLRLTGPRIGVLYDGTSGLLLDTVRFPKDVTRKSVAFIGDSLISVYSDFRLSDGIVIWYYDYDAHEFIAKVTTLDFRTLEKIGYATPRIFSLPGGGLGISTFTGASVQGVIASYYETLFLNADGQILSVLGTNAFWLTWVPSNYQILIDGNDWHYNRREISSESNSMIVLGGLTDVLRRWRTRSVHYQAPIATGSPVHFISRFDNGTSIFSDTSHWPLRLPSQDSILSSLTSQSTLLASSKISDTTVLLRSVAFFDTAGVVLDTVESTSPGSLQTWLLGVDKVGFVYSPSAKTMYRYDIHLDADISDHYLQQDPDTMALYSALRSTAVVLTNDGVDAYQFTIGGITYPFVMTNTIVTSAERIGVFVDTLRAFSARRPDLRITTVFPRRFVIDITEAVSSRRVSSDPVLSISVSPTGDRLLLCSGSRQSDFRCSIVDAVATASGKIILDELDLPFAIYPAPGALLSNHTYATIRSRPGRELSDRGKFALDTSHLVISKLPDDDSESIIQFTHDGCVIRIKRDYSEDYVYRAVPRARFRSYWGKFARRFMLWTYDREDAPSYCHNGQGASFFEAVYQFDPLKPLTSSDISITLRSDKAQAEVIDAQPTHDDNILITTTLGVSAMHPATKDTLFHIPVRNIRAAVQLTDSVIVTSAGAIFRTDTGWATGWRIGYQDFLRLYPVSRSAVLVIRSSADSIGTVFDVQTGEVLRHLGKGYGVTTAADFDPVRGRLYLGSANGILGVWDLSEFLDSTSTSTQLDDATLLRPNVSFANGTISVDNLETNAVIDVYTYHGQLLSRSSATPFDVHNITLSPDFTTGVVYVVVRTAEGTSAHPIVVYR